MLAIEQIRTIEGPLYAVQGEDSELYVFDCEVVAQTQQGNFGNNYIVKGYHSTDSGEGFSVNVPNRNYKDDCAKFVVELQNTKQIDPSIWYKIPEPLSLEENLELEAELDNRERQGLSLF